MTYSVSLSKVQAAFLVFAVTAIIFFVFRIGLFPVAEHDAGGVQTSTDITLDFSAERNMEGYRPFSYYFQDKVGSLYGHYNDLYHPYVVFLVSLLNGLIALLIFGICHHQTRSTAISLAASFLYVFAGAAIVSSWQNIYAVFQTPLHLIILGSIFSYLQFRTARESARWYWLALLVMRVFK